MYMFVCIYAVMSKFPLQKNKYPPNQRSFKLISCWEWGRESEWLKLGLPELREDNFIIQIETLLRVKKHTNNDIKTTSINQDYLRETKTCLFYIKRIKLYINVYIYN